MVSEQQIATTAFLHLHYVGFVDHEVHAAEEITDSLITAKCFYLHKYLNSGQRDKEFKLKGN